MAANRAVELGESGVYFLRDWLSRKRTDSKDGRGEFKLECAQVGDLFVVVDTQSKFSR
jgi:hypothetical protein